MERCPPKPHGVTIVVDNTTGRVVPDRSSVIKITELDLSPSPGDMPSHLSDQQVAIESSAICLYWWGLRPSSWPVVEVS